MLKTTPLLGDYTHIYDAMAHRLRHNLSLEVISSDQDGKRTRFNVQLRNKEAGTMCNYTYTSIFSTEPKIGKVLDAMIASSHNATYYDFADELPLDLSYKQFVSEEDFTYECERIFQNGQESLSKLQVLLGTADENLTDALLRAYFPNFPSFAE